jgi:hypothetical protein
MTPEERRLARIEWAKKQQEIANWLQGKRDELKRKGLASLTELIKAELVVRFRGEYRAHAIVFVENKTNKLIIEVRVFLVNETARRQAEVIRNWLRKHYVEWVNFMRFSIYTQKYPGNQMEGLVKEEINKPDNHEF